MTPVTSLLETLSPSSRIGEADTLQVKSGSYAEGLYRKLGFVEAFVSPIFVRPS